MPNTNHPPVEDVPGMGLRKVVVLPPDAQPVVIAIL